ncbi:hypothetical protein PY365_16250 [Roseiarcaceae bacterium H3SJ34-1]|uniref:hypothetical protein n=1 Tax=Terripilifer ovatus TaxID=3032367 RepID=UPI003AB9AFBB|nr:hypothetical protein [Roseiarcaceae bacterium H3SJ34-1]
MMRLALSTSLILATCAAQAAAPAARMTLGDETQTVFQPPRDACDGNDVPDVNPRAFRDADNTIAMFALHDVNRALRGKDLSHLKLDCKVVYRSSFSANPAAYDHQSWIAATWTDNGKDIAAIIHHEFHGDRNGLCNIPKDKAGLGCWFNTLIAANSTDGGASFHKLSSPVVASSPFRQDVDQGRHRGFFNPSNIVSSNGYKYFFSNTTGWPGQQYGVCLFRSAEPGKPNSWSAFDGKDFSIRYADPYGPPQPLPAECKPIAPFPVAPGAVVRQRGSGLWLAVVQAWKDDKFFPVSGFYYATSRDLTTWSEPRLLFATRTLFDNACGADRLNSYPSILDEQAKTRNFEDVGEDAWLYYASMRVDGCSHTSDRTLVRRKITIRAEGQVR